MVKIYVSSRFEDRDRATRVCELLSLAGFQITSTWMTEPVTNTMANIRSTPERAVAMCARDLREIEACDILVNLVPPLDIKWRGTGGRHVELGYAIARGKSVIVVGDRENIFHYSPSISWFPTEEEFLSAYTKAAKTNAPLP